MWSLFLTSVFLPFTHLTILVIFYFFALNYIGGKTSNYKDIVFKMETLGGHKQKIAETILELNSSKIL